jgi:hypothetical protein
VDNLYALNWKPTGFEVKWRYPDEYVEVYKNISFTGKYSSEIVIPKLFYYHINITGNLVQDSSVKLYLPENIIILTSDVSLKT